MSLNDRLVLECPETYDDMEEQLNNEEEAAAEHNVTTNGGDGVANSHVDSMRDEEEVLEDLENLQARENLDRSSPNLWPDQIPGIFVIP